MHAKSPSIPSRRTAPGASRAGGALLSAPPSNRTTSYSSEQHANFSKFRNQFPCLTPARLLRRPVPSRSRRLRAPRSRYLQDDAALDEVVKGDLPPSLSVELPNEGVVKLVREPVPWRRRAESVPTLPPQTPASPSPENTAWAPGDVGPRDPRQQAHCNTLRAWWPLCSASPTPRRDSLRDQQPLPGGSGVTQSPVAVPLAQRGLLDPVDSASLTAPYC